MVAFLAITSVASAQTRTPVINHRLHRQERRIAMAERHGRITPMQANHMRARDRRIREERRMAMNSGRYNRFERRHIRHQERHINRAIRHDEQMDKVS